MLALIHTMIDLKLIFQKKIMIFQVILLVGLDNNMLSFLLGIACVTTYNIGIWLCVKY